MGLFGSSKKQQKRESTLIKEWTYPQADNFRGCTRIKLSTYGYDPISEGINAVKVKNPKYGISDKEGEYCFDLKGQTITIRELSYGIDNNRCLAFFVEEHHLGTHFCEANDELRRNLYSDNIEKIFLKLSAINAFDGKKTTPQEVVYLFVKNKE